MAIPIIFIHPPVNTSSAKSPTPKSPAPKPPAKLPITSNTTSPNHVPISPPLRTESELKLLEKQIKFDHACSLM